MRGCAVTRLRTGRGMRFARRRGCKGPTICVGCALSCSAALTPLDETPAEAGEAVINREIPALGGDGGAIVLSAGGQVGMPFNTEGMARGWIGTDGVPHVALFSDETLPMPGTGAPAP